MLEAFAQAKSPLSARDAEDMLRSMHIRANTTTIYRELQFMVAHGYITEVYLSPKSISYESADLKHHHFLVCESCGTIENMTNCHVSDLETTVYKKNGFKVTRHSLEFYGQCARCVRQA